MAMYLLIVDTGESEKTEVLTVTKQTAYRKYYLPAASKVKAGEWFSAGLYDQYRDKRFAYCEREST